MLHSSLNDHQKLLVASLIEGYAAVQATEGSKQLYQFVEKHISVIRQLIQQDPRFLLGSMDFIILNPDLYVHFQDLVKSLPFDERQQWLREKIHEEQAKLNFKGLSLTVTRGSLFEASCTLLSPDKAKEENSSLKGELNVRFEGEDGVGAGVKREWFRVLSNEMFNPDYALFINSGTANTFQPNPKSYVNPGKAVSDC
jgi:E3 ubiquitin-protein ligase HACE1